MKAILFTMLFISSICGFAQEKEYSVTVKSTGKQAHKYVYFYTYTQSSLKKVPLSPEGVVFKGKYMSTTKDGSFPSALMVLSDRDSLPEQGIGANESYLKRGFLLEPKVDITYDADKNSFSVKGDSLNKVNNLFQDNEWKYKLKEDSLISQLYATQKNVELREKERKKIRKANFLEEKQHDLDLVKQNINSQVALQNFIIFTMVPIRPVAETRAVFNLFARSLRQSTKGKFADSLITVQENMFKAEPKIGEQLPAFQLEDNKGVLISSKSLSSKYTLIDFWASWCAPCRAETQNLIAAYTKYHQKGLNVIAISIDPEKDRGKWLAAIDKDKSGALINLFNPGGTSGIAKDLGINIIPANYLIDQTGKIIAINLRGTELDTKLKELFTHNLP